MSKFITKIRTNEGDKQIDYNALANLPVSSASVKIAEQALVVESDVDICEVPLERVNPGDVLHVEINDNGKITSVDIPTYESDGQVWFDPVYPEDCNWTIYCEAGPVASFWIKDFVAYEAKSSVTIYNATIKEFDEKFIPDTIARTADVEAVLDELHAYAQALIGGDA